MDKSEYESTALVVATMAKQTRKAAMILLFWALLLFIGKLNHFTAEDRTFPKVVYFNVRAGFLFRKHYYIE